jgi:AraC-like DNA-binding protein
MQRPEPVTMALMPHLRRAKDLMDREYADRIDLDVLGRAAGCSRFHFARSFRTVYGETPGRYLTRRRVERAKDLLRATNLTVTEVCYLVGFSSLGSFSTRFAELVGVSPSAYRRNAEREGGPPPIPGCFVLMWTRPHVAVPSSNPGEAPTADPPVGLRTGSPMGKEEEGE